MELRERELEARWEMELSSKPQRQESQYQQAAPTAKPIAPQLGVVIPKAVRKRPARCAIDIDAEWAEWYSAHPEVARPGGLAERLPQTKIDPRNADLTVQPLAD